MSKRRLATLFRHSPTWAVLLVAGALVACIAYLDYVTGRDIAFSIFYVLPVGAVAWSVRPPLAHGFAFIAGAAWLVADVTAAGDVDHAVVLWNAGVRLSFFVLVTHLLSQIRRLTDRERHLAHTDPLTGLANTRAFHERARIEFARQRRNSEPLSLAYLDLDGFKAVNDAGGHLIGDQVLNRVAGILASGLRATDLAARFGGDEFVLLLPSTAGEGARTLLGKLKEAIERAMVDSGWRVTVSAGILTIVDEDLGVEEAIRRTDELMYEVKRSGKNAILQASCRDKYPSDPRFEQDGPPMVRPHTP